MSLQENRTGKFTKKMKGLNYCHGKSSKVLKVITKSLCPSPASICCVPAGFYLNCTPTTIAWNSKCEIFRHYKLGIGARTSDSHLKSSNILGRILLHGWQYTSLATILGLGIIIGSGKKVYNEWLLLTTMRKGWFLEFSAVSLLSSLSSLHWPYHLFAFPCPIQFPAWWFHMAILLEVVNWYHQLKEQKTNVKDRFAYN